MTDDELRTWVAALAANAGSLNAVDRGFVAVPIPFAKKIGRAVHELLPADANEPADKDWMVARGWVWSDFLNFEWEFGNGFSLYLELIGQNFQILSRTEYVRDSGIVPCRCRTRGDVRRIEAAFNLSVKEGK